jgi:hypothetical protein
MKLRQSLVRSWVCLLFVTLAAVGCGSSRSSGNGPVTVDAYESCYDGDYCLHQLTCAGTVLSASTGVTGYFCTSGCYYDSDCYQPAGTYDSFCVSGQCYLSCPTGSSGCPYDQSCVTFSTTTGLISLCAP